MQKIRSVLASLLKLPVYKRIKAKLSIVPRKKLVTSSIICLLIIISVSSYVWLTRRPATVTEQPPVKTATLVKGTPNYSTILPAHKTIKELGGWTRVSPPDRNPVFTYVDKIDNYAINVSEQPLPNNFKPDTTEQINQLAKDFNANEKITVGSTTVHIGISQQGPQRIIFSKDNLLILITSSVRIENSQWSDYIGSLQ